MVLTTRSQRHQHLTDFFIPAFARLDGANEDQDDEMTAWASRPTILFGYAFVICFFVL
jgi:hypothetical protein